MYNSSHPFAITKKIHQHLFLWILWRVYMHLWSVTERCIGYAACVLLGGLNIMFIFEVFLQLNCGDACQNDIQEIINVVTMEQKDLAK